MSLASKTKLGPYEILSQIGAGGMGEVFLATDTRLDRKVAIKVLPAEFASDRQRLCRFEQEAKTLAALNHPSIVSIFDTGMHEGAPYLVSELLEGQTLRDELKSGALPLRKAIEYALQIANGLAAAHAKGIIHRDLKPENIFVTKDGRVKILDFGLAKLKERGQGSADRGRNDANSGAVTLVQSTEPGVVLGTVGYMSPEQVRGEEADHRSDIFAFGCILYEMFSGQRAFRRETSVQTMNAILTEDPGEFPIGKEAPPLERLMRRCIEKDPERRFHSAQDLAFALETNAWDRQRVSSDRRSQGKALRHARIAALASIASILLLAAGFGLAGLWQGKSTERTAPPRASFLQLTSQPGEEISPRLSPDGASFIYVSEAGGNPDIYFQRVGGHNAINLTQDSHAQDYAPAFSPDGNAIAFRSVLDSLKTDF